MDANPDLAFHEMNRHYTLSSTCHCNQKGIQTIYQSLDDIKVEKGNQVKQGDVIGKAGNNVYQSTLKKHLHFIVSIDDKTVNPDKYFNQKIEKIKTTS